MDVPRGNGDGSGDGWGPTPRRVGALDDAGPDALARAARRLRPPAGALRAVRCWEFDETDLCLLSLGHGAVWWPGGTLVASCELRSLDPDPLATIPGQEPSCHAPDEPIPGLVCTCGVYAAKTIGWLVGHVVGGGWRLPTDRSLARVTVVGEVLLWGRIVEHEEGYRASMASVGAIYRPVGRSHASRGVADTANRAAAAFGVPCVPCLGWRPEPGPWANDAA